MRASMLGLMTAVAGLVSLPVLGQSRLAELEPVGLEVAAIDNTGSTNTNGYHVNVPLLGGKQYGRVDYWNTSGTAPASRTHSGALPARLVKKFAHDLTAAMPLAQLPITLQFKSISFGTSTYITYKGQRTPDLSAPADARGQALKADITAIAAALNLRNGPRRPALPNDSNRFLVR